MTFENHIFTSENGIKFNEYKIHLSTLHPPNDYKFALGLYGYDPEIGYKTRGL